MNVGRNRSAPQVAEDELAAGGGGVDRLLEAAEPDPAVSQAGDGVDQVPQGPAEPVELPDDQGVAGAELVQELLEGGAVGAGAAGGLGEHPVAAGTLQGVDLEVGLLVGGGDDVDFGHEFWIPLSV